MGELIQGALARALERQRDRYNALFAQKRRASPSLDGERFGEFLRSSVAPVVDAVAAVDSERIQELSDALYEIALEVVVRDFPSRYPSLVRGWSALLSALPQHVSANSFGFPAAVTNALYNLAVTPGARPEEWTETMLALGRQVENPSALLDAGKVAAWRCGMAHFREGALQTARQMDPQSVHIALRIPYQGGVSVGSLLDRLRANPWLDPANLDGSPRPPRMFHRLGGFCGFGGEFIRPPTAVLSDGEFLLSDGESVWALCADRFGATLHRTRANRLPAAPTVMAPAELAASVPRIREASSIAAHDSTTVFTLPLSHFVHVAGRG